MPLPTNMKIPAATATVKRLALDRCTRWQTFHSHLSLLHMKRLIFQSRLALSFLRARFLPMQTIPTALVCESLHLLCGLGNWMVADQVYSTIDRVHMAHPKPPALGYTVKLLRWKSKIPSLGPFRRLSRYSKLVTKKGNVAREPPSSERRVRALNVSLRWLKVANILSILTDDFSSSTILIESDRQKVIHQFYHSSLAVSRPFIN